MLETVRAPSPTFPTIAKLPSSGVAPPPGPDSGWTPLLYGGLALAAAAATLSLSVRLRPAPVRRPPTGGGMGGGQRLHRRPERGAAPPAVPAAREAASLVAKVAPIEDFSAFLDTLRALSDMSGVARARADRLQKGAGLYRLLLEPWVTPEEFVRLASEALGRAVTIASG